MKLIAILAAVSLMLLAGAAQAATPSWGNHLDQSSVIADKNAHVTGHQTGTRPQIAGENISNAIVIAGLPFTATGNSCNYLNDYDVVCPYSGSTSPDVVYSYTPAANQAINVDLCSSLYDTKVYIFDGSPTTPIACNDDAGCGITGFQSALGNVALQAGHTYYIVVDGYGGDCGTYTMNVTEHVPCVTCQPNDMPEAEPTCGDFYDDTYDGGCNSAVPVFLPVTCGAICGTTGTFQGPFGDTRDTDWYEITVGPGTFTYSGVGDGFELQLLVLDAACPANLINYTINPSCTSGSATFTGPGTFHLWAGPSGYSGVPCGSKYRLQITGPGIQDCLATAGAKSSWGALKLRYR